MYPNRLSSVSRLMLSILIIGSASVIALTMAFLPTTATRTFAASSQPPTWALPFQPKTQVILGTYGLHDHNFSAITDDTPPHKLFTFTNPKDNFALDFLLCNNCQGTSSIPATPLASGTVIAVQKACHVILIDHGNGWWAEYVHLANIQVTSGQHVTVNTLLGYPNTKNLACGEVSPTEHIHLTIANGSGTTGTYVTLQNQELCGHQVVERNNNRLDVFLPGLVNNTGDTFTVPTCKLTVNTTADNAAPCKAVAYSLRCAITQANTDGKDDTIQFDIPSSDPGCKLTTIQGQSVYVCTITPTSGIPSLTASNTTIIGYGQVGSLPNTNLLGSGDNAILTIRLDGSKGAGGLVISGSASNDTIEGLEITNFNYGILVWPNTVTNASIVGNFIGTDGGSALANNLGIYVSGAKYTTIGGVTPDTINLISGNNQEGILIGGGFEETIVGNYIGTDRSGMVAVRGSSSPQGSPPLNKFGIPNGAGVYTFASSFNTFIGSTTPNAANIIAHNSYGVITDGGRNTNITANKISSNYIGVYVNDGEFEDRVFQNTIYNNTDAGVLVGNSSTDHARVSIKQNSIYSNGGLGIDLSPQDTVNCSGPVPGAPNDYQPCPIIQSASTTQVSGTATPNSFVEVYIATNEADDQGHGEGKTFLGSVYADTNGNWSVSVTLSSGNVVTAAATLTTNGVGETSEFAANVTVP